MPEQWPEPASEEIQTVVSMLVEPQLRRLFYAELENPLWLSHLDAAGQFDRIPEPYLDEDGSSRVLPWPEGDYLIRVASEEPDLVADILIRHRTSTSIWYQRAIVDAALRLPPKEAQRLVPPIRAFVRSGSRWVEAKTVVALAASLLKSELGEGAELLNELFCPFPGEREGTFGPRAAVSTRLGDHFYEMALAEAHPTLLTIGERGLRLVMDWLLAHEKIMQDGASYDISHVWRPSIAPHEQNSGMEDVGDALVTEVVRLAVGVASTLGLRRALEILTAPKEAFVFRRIALDVIRQCVAEADGVALAMVHLVDPESLRIDARPDYIGMARAALPLLSEDQVYEWSTFVSGGSWQDDDDSIRRMLTWRDEDAAPEVTADQIDEVRRSRLHRLLSPLDGFLRGPLADRYVELSEEFGPVEHPEFSAFHASFVGPTSPLSVDEMSAMAPADLASFLSSWKPEERMHFGPTVEGLARTLQQVATAQPELVEMIAESLPRSGRSYVRAAFMGWAAAIAEAGYVPSQKVWDLARWSTGRTDESLDRGNDFDADDPIWQYAQDQAIRLVEAGIAKWQRNITAELAHTFLDIVAPLSSHPDPTEEREREYGGSNMDPLTFSLNSTRPTAIRVLLRLGEVTAGSDGADDVAGAVLGLVDDHAGPERDPSLAVAAVFGEGLGRLHTISADWFASQAPALIRHILDPDDRMRGWSDVVLSVGLRSYRPGRFMLAFFRPAFSQMLSSEYHRLDHIDGWRDGRRSTVDAAANFIVSCLTWQLIDRDDDLVIRLFTAPEAAEPAANALGLLGWAMINQEPDEDFRIKAQTVIDWRVEEIQAGRASPKELGSFYWWVRSNRYPPSWWLPVLRLAITEPGFDPKGMIGEALQGAATSEPRLVVEALSTLLSRASDWHEYDLLQHAAQVIAAALLSDDAEAAEIALQLQDHLARRGHLSIIDDVRALTEDAPLA